MRPSSMQASRTQVKSSQVKSSAPKRERLVYRLPTLPVGHMLLPLARGFDRFHGTPATQSAPGTALQGLQQPTKVPPLGPEQTAAVALGFDLVGMGR